MNVIDTHCDILYKLQMARRKQNIELNYRTSIELEANLKRLQAGGVLLQFFAIFIDPQVPYDEKWGWALEQIQLFKTEVIGKNREIKHIRKWTDLHHLNDDEIGAVLTLEGAEPIGKDINKLMYLYEEGVLSVGLTWNKANFCADGVYEERHGGLTSFGDEVIQFNNEYRILTDVSHLSDRSFWDVVERANYVFASHSNTRFICDHPRNLSDIQISALFAKNGLVNVTFYPPFIYELYGKKRTTTEHIIHHIQHLCSLGGRNHIGFGSDFDGIDMYVDDLRHAADYQSFINVLLAHFSHDDVHRFAQQNFIRFISDMEVDE